MGLRLLFATIIFTIFLPREALPAQEIHEHPTIRRMHHVNNSLRGRFQLPAQILSPRLSRAAQYQAEYMAGTHKFSHYVNGSPGSRAGKYGYSGIVVENIARAYCSVEEAFFAWADSPKHWEALIDSNTEVGFGYSIAEDGTTYWVAVYGTPNSTSASTQQYRQVESLNRPSSPSRIFIQPSPAAIRQSRFLLIGS